MLLSNLSVVVAAALLSKTTASRLPEQFSSTKDSLYPRIADTSHASPQLVQLMTSYYTAKTLYQVDKWAAFFDPNLAVYADTTLGLVLSQPNLKPSLGQFVQTWHPNGKSYPLKIIGDTHGAIIIFVNTPELFGDEIRVITCLDFKDGKVLRQVDHWDGRRNVLSGQRVPDDQYPKDFAYELSLNNTNNLLGSVVQKLQTALSEGNTASAVDLLSYDAVLEDHSLRTRIEGRLAIRRYFDRALSSVPYGAGSSLRHVVGSAQGGGYEWVDNSTIRRTGITAVELNCDGLITQLTTVWDTLKTTDGSLKELAELSLES
ncbi:hypothetical protein F4803DRAFT_575165 [Xylaria telfairii]|nr:hypothetical protein F4803DRAFT_575165 [Xylaria telfairii]